MCRVLVLLSDSSGVIQPPLLSPLPRIRRGLRCPPVGPHALPVSARSSHGAIMAPIDRAVATAPVLSVCVMLAGS